ncbi:MAG: L,D-transpeptidase [Actinomycetota bacterium]|nr:L,D-transpeptidase [Actinomycetota bacterium]
MNKDQVIAGGRRRRPLVLILATLALGALAWAGLASWTAEVGAGRPIHGLVEPTSNRGAPGRDRTTAVSPTQELVTLLHPHEIRSEAAGSAAPLGLVPARTPITEARTVLPVVARNGQWSMVRLPGRPNGHTGWINGAATARSVTSWHIGVDLSHRQVTVYRAGRPVRVFAAVVGKPSTPTPTGEFFVQESIALRPTQVGAPFAFALSARSNVLQEFGGGPGQIAIHGLKNIGGVLGSAVSHGCVRLRNEAMRWLAVRIGSGVPVTITS